jgi:hypothetical protein
VLRGFAVPEHNSAVRRCTPDNAVVPSDQNTKDIRRTGASQKKIFGCDEERTPLMQWSIHPSYSSTAHTHSTPRAGPAVSNSRCSHRAHGRLSKDDDATSAFAHLGRHQSTFVLSLSLSPSLSLSLRRLQIPCLLNLLPPTSFHFVRLLATSASAISHGGG